MVTHWKPPAAAPAAEAECEFNVYSPACPARAVLDHLADKWALLVLDRLAAEPLRFNALRRDIQGISQKVLSQVLKRLERDGLISRAAFATVPVTVEYALTGLGHDLTRQVGTLLRWAEGNIGAIKVAQSAYDARAMSQP